MLRMIQVHISGRQAQLKSGLTAVPRNALYRDVKRRTMEIPQRTPIFKADCRFRRKFRDRRHSLHFPTNCHEKYKWRPWIKPHLGQFR